MKALTKTDFNFPGQKSVYHGKVRDVYNINGEKLVMVATDRISAFDVVLPEGIPYKGQFAQFARHHPQQRLQPVQLYLPQYHAAHQGQADARPGRFLHAPVQA